jgi:hypothetical protein
MFDWIQNLWTALSSTLQNICSALNTAYTQMDTFNFDNVEVITKSLAMVHYIAGSPIYYAIITLIITSIGFMIWTCIKAILDIASKLKSGGLKITKFRGF